jgi:hypothetical protein
MKKLLTILILSFALFYFSPSVFAVPTATAYVVDYYDNATWNLETGAYQANTDYAMTGKIRVIGHYVLPDITNAHYMLVWNSKGYYYGYFTLDGNVDTSAKYLGAWVSGEVSLPGLTTEQLYFALVVNKYATGEHTNLSNGGGGYYTYADIFDTPTYENYYMALADDTLTSVLANPSETAYTDSVLTTTLGAVMANPEYLDFVPNSVVVKDALNIGDLSLADSFGYADTVITNIGYDKTSLDNAVAGFTADGVTVLSLTNLIQNGQFSVDSNNDGLADNWSIPDGGTPSIVSGVQRVYGNNILYGVSLLQERVLTGGQNYYYACVGSGNASTDFTRQIYFRTGYDFMYNSTTPFTNLSTIFTSATNNVQFKYIIRHVPATIPLPSTAYMAVDNVSLFNSGAYTKAQIDTALSKFGYLTYNTAYSLPDVTDGDFIESGYAYTGTRDTSNLIILNLQDLHNDDIMPFASWNSFNEWRAYWTYYEHNAGANFQTLHGINRALLTENGYSAWDMTNAQGTYYTHLYYDGVNEADRAEWYYFGGVTDETYLYYTFLYEDAVAHYDRWEWYLYAGIENDTEWDYFKDLYADGIAHIDRYEWYDTKGITAENFAVNRARYDYLTDRTPISYANFDNSTFYYLVEPIIEYTLKQKINMWLEDDLGLSALVINLLALGFMLLALVPLFIFKAKWFLYIVVELPLFAFFVVMEWFAIWVVILVVAIAVLAMYFVFGKSNG